MKIITTKIAIGELVRVKSTEEVVEIIREQGHICEIVPVGKTKSRLIPCQWLEAIMMTDTGMIAER